jgi:hypothetical protein
MEETASVPDAHPFEFTATLSLVSDSFLQRVSLMRRQGLVVHHLRLP